MSVEDQFNAAVKVIRSLPKNGTFQPSDELKLKFYGFFKQATEGPNRTKKPPFYDIVGRYKWDAWSKCGEMSKQDAMRSYIEELKKVVETISLTEPVGDFLDQLEPFYEFLPEDIVKAKLPNVDLSKKVTPNGNVSMFNSYDSEGDEFSDTFDSAQSVLPSEPSSQVDQPNQPSSGHINVFKSDNCLVKPDHSGFTAVNNNATVATTAAATLGFSEQLTLAVFRLQHSLEQIVHRVESIESKAAALQKSNNKWPLQELNPKTAAFIIGWPFVAYFLISYIKQLRKK